MPIEGNGFNKKIIKLTLAKKLKYWLESIDDKGLRDLCKRDAVVTGGAIVSLLEGNQPNDYDIYFRSYSTTVQVAKYYVAKFLEVRTVRGGHDIPIYVEELKDIRGKDRVRVVVKSAGVERAASAKPALDYAYFEASPVDSGASAEYIEEVLTDPAEVMDTEETVRQDLSDSKSTDSTKTRKAFTPRFVSSNAITLTNDVQIILRFYGKPEDIHNTFDYVHCMNYYTAADNTLHVNTDSMLAIMSKTLVYNGSLYPVASLVRMRKFIQRGWRINAGQILKICLQISKLNLESVIVLEDQLTGVDVAYCNQLFSYIKENNPETIDQAYLVEIIDQIF